MSVDLSSAVAVITGGGSGMGRATAHSFVRRGARVVVTDINLERAATVADELGDAAVAAHCDVTKMDEIEAARDLALERFGRLDVVMNNVGVSVQGDIEDIPLEGWERLIDINLMGVVRGVSAFLPTLLAQGSGYIVNTASTGGLLPYGFDRIPYTSTKYAVVGLTESLAVSLRPRGIGVSCLCPAPVRTNMYEQITVYGTPSHPVVAPKLTMVEPDVVGEMVADAVETDRFLILTTPEVADHVRERGADIDAYVERMIREYT